MPVACRSLTSSAAIHFLPSALMERRRSSSSSKPAAINPPSCVRAGGSATIARESSETVADMSVMSLRKAIRAGAVNSSNPDRRPGKTARDVFSATRSRGVAAMSATRPASLSKS